MTSLYAKWMLGLAMLWGIFAPATLSASAIEDRAGFFSQDAIRDADVKLAGVQKQYNAELRIETYNGVPDDQKANLAAMSKEQRSKYFQTWMQRRAGEIHARGVLVLICKDPPHLELGSGAEFRRRGFTDAQRAEMTSHLMTSFKAKKYDDGLRKLVDDFSNDASRLAAVGTAPQSTNHAQSPGFVPVGRHQQGIGNMSWLWTVGLIFLAVWIISALFRGIAHAGGGMMGGGTGMPMGGGTFGGGFLSGLFGSMAGMWMYDSLFRNHAYGSGMGGYNDPGAMNTWNDSPVGTNDGSDFQSSGGDFGSDDNAGGGFFGGGDSGGFADFGGGGGDFGGGGGDFGGGGGDFG